jgi:hypothetical protein
LPQIEESLQLLAVALSADRGFLLQFGSCCHHLADMPAIDLDDHKSDRTRPQISSIRPIRLKSTELYVRVL